MDVFFLIARIAFALGFLGLGVGVLKDRKAEPLVQAVGVAAVLGALFIGFGVLADLGAILVAVGVLKMTYLRHQFWNERGTAKELAKVHFLKNLSLLGAAAIVFWIYNQGQGSVPFSLTDPLIGPWL